MLGVCILKAWEPAQPTLPSISSRAPHKTHLPAPQHDHDELDDHDPAAAYQQSGPTTSDLAERFTGPSRECMEWLGEMRPSAGDVCSCIAGCASRALESGALPLTSASSCGRQSVNPRAAVISTDRQTEALSDSKFSEVVEGTLGSEKAREGPIPSMLGRGRERG